jgi:hypothetical protein
MAGLSAACECMYIASVATDKSRNDSTRPLPAATLWLMIMTVWVDSWQMQCCGDPFSRSSTLAWTLRDADPDWFDAIHRNGGPDSGRPLPLRVPGQRCGPSCPVRGSGVLTEVESADGWTADRGEERFVGYLVQFTL